MTSARSATKISTLTTQFRPDRRAWTKEREASLSDRQGQDLIGSKNRVVFGAHGDKGAMPQVPGVCPFEECDLADELPFDPTAVLHFLCAQPNGRCNQENVIEQLKNGVNAVRMPVTIFSATGPTW
jgi:hypothetical protein